jgi:hypothetical protein
VFRKLKLITDCFTENDLSLIYFQSIDSGFDDYANLSLKMGFQEFTEFLCRAAEHISPAALGESDDLPI